MKSQQFKAAQATTAAAISAAFLQLWELGQPFPEGVELVPNGTGYFDKTVDAFRDVPAERHTMYATKDVRNRKVLVIPIKNFGSLYCSDEFSDESKSLVMFERFAGGEVIIEQLTLLNNADLDKTFRMAELIARVGDWLI